MFTGGTMKKWAFILCIFVLCYTAWTQQKYALVIGNSNYTRLSRLANPINDANDMTDALQSLGFIFDKILDGDLDKMENTVIRLKNYLSVSKNSYDFLFFAGHGVQSNGMNYLIPVSASIRSENSLRERSLSVQRLLDKLNDWWRSGSRGLTVISNQPADSIVVYDTSASSIPQDGTGSNRLFTSHLLKNLKTSDLIEATQYYTILHYVIMKFVFIHSGLSSLKFIYLDLNRVYVFSKRQGGEK
jgi:uncharacterized caspase-like protein